MNTQRVIENNGRLLAWYLFQYSVLIPFMAFINPTSVVGAFGICLLGLSVWNSKSILVAKRIIRFILFMLLVLLCKVVFQRSSGSIIAYFLAIACPGLFLVSQDFDRDAFLACCQKLAVINFMINFWNPFWGGGYEYMRFGYGMVPTIIFLYIALSLNNVRKHKLIIIGMFIVALLEAVIYGSRGCILVVIAFITIDSLVITRGGIKKVVAILAALIGYFNISKIIDALAVLLRGVGIDSYSIRKIQIQLASGFNAASSGRDALYDDAIERIQQHPFAGNPMGEAASDNYAHNIFLQLGVDLGVFAVIIFVLFLIYSLFILFSKKYSLKDKQTLNAFLSISMGRLLFSSTLWRRPEFWLYVGFVLVLKNKREQMYESTDY